MWDVRIAELAGRQFNRVSRRQLLELGLTERAVDYRLRTGQLVLAEQGVYALAPLLADDEWGRWMGATLTAPESVLSMASAAAAWELWSLPRRFESVTRPGSGGPRWHGGVRVYRSSTLEGERTILRGIPITTPARTLLDLSRWCGDRALAKAVREAIRLDRTSLAEIAELLGRHRGRRGSRRLGLVLSRYSGLPLERARSGAEVRALEILRNANRPFPRLNVRIAGEEADLSWARERLIIEIDGGPYHLDIGEDARKEAAWKDARWTVRRLSSDAVYDHPKRLLTLAPRANVPNTTP